MSALIVFVLAAGLAIDVSGGEYGQAVAVVLCWIAVAHLWRRSTKEERLGWASCMAIATAGEIFLSLGWGLYTYRLGNIPMFVPPGHVLVFALGLALAKRIPEGAPAWIALLALPFIALFALEGTDTMSAILFGFYVLCLAASDRKRLYASMFIVSLALEIAGTRLGNWAWAPVDPWLGLTMQNPPLAVGAFYCVLDLLVVAATGRFGGRPLFLRRRMGPDDSVELSYGAKDPTHA